MKTTFLFFSCALLCISLKGMHNTLLSKDLIRYILPDGEGIHYELINLINKSGILDRKQAEEYNAFLNNYIMPLVNISRTSKGFHTNQLLDDEIKKRKEKMTNIQHFSGNALHKYKTFTTTFKNNAYAYYKGMLDGLSWINLCSLSQKNAQLGGNYTTEDYSLHLYLILGRAQDFVFTNNNLYEKMYDFCKEISTQLSKDLLLSTLCEQLRQECLDKKTLSIKRIRSFLNNLYNGHLKEDEDSEKRNTYFQEALVFLNIGKVRCPMNLSFGLTFRDGTVKNHKSFFRIKSIISGNFMKNGNFNHPLFFNYVQKTFNDDLEKTNKIILASEKLPLRYSDEKVDYIDQETLGVDYLVNFKIEDQDKNSIKTSDQQIIPLDLIDFFRNS